MQRPTCVGQRSMRGQFTLVLRSQMTRALVIWYHVGKQYSDSFVMSKVHARYDDKESLDSKSNIVWYVDAHWVEKVAQAFRSRGLEHIYKNALLKCAKQGSVQLGYWRSRYPPGSPSATTYVTTLHGASCKTPNSIRLPRPCNQRT
jgi:hypothetical protein